MARVKDIMSTELVVVSPELSLRGLIERLANEHVSGVPVLAGAKLVGVVTLDDVVSFQASLPPVPRNGDDELGWDDEAGPATAEGDDPAGAYFQELWADAGAELVERAQAVSGPEWDALAEHTVAEAMTRRLWTIGPDRTVEEAARLMRDKDIHRLLVAADGRLLGILTMSDISNAVAAGKLWTKC